MPKILNYTPPWLARPSPGSKIFSHTTTNGSQTSKSLRTSQSSSPNGVKPNESYQGPRRLLANRGTEIFTVVDNKIRWADLARVKSDGEEQTDAQRAHASAASSQRQDEDSAPYRVGYSCPSETLAQSLTLSDSYGSSLPEDTPTNHLAFEAVPSHPYEAYRPCRHFAGLKSSERRRWNSLEA
jgi:hypothetical protein